MSWLTAKRFYLPSDYIKSVVITCYGPEMDFGLNTDNFTIESSVARSIQHIDFLLHHSHSDEELFVSLTVICIWNRVCKTYSKICGGRYSL